MKWALTISLAVALSAIILILIVFLPKTTHYYDTSLYPKVIDTFKTAGGFPILDEDTKARLDNKELWAPPPGDWRHEDGSIDKNYIYSIICPKKEKGDVYGDLVEYLGAPHAALYKISARTILKQHRACKCMNKLIRIVIPIFSPSSNINRYGISIDQETKPLIRLEPIIYDASKKYSFYNQTSEEGVFLMLDMPRKKGMPLGISEECPGH